MQTVVSRERLGNGIPTYPAASNLLARRTSDAVQPSAVNQSRIALCASTAWGFWAIGDRHRAGTRKRKRGDASSGSDAASSADATWSAEGAPRSNGSPMPASGGDSRSSLSSQPGTTLSRARSGDRCSRSGASPFAIPRTTSAPTASCDATRSRTTSGGPSSASIVRTSRIPGAAAGQDQMRAEVVGAVEDLAARVEDRVARSTEVGRTRRYSKLPRLEFVDGGLLLRAAHDAGHAGPSPCSRLASHLERHAATRARRCPRCAVSREVSLDVRTVDVRA